MNKQIFDIIIQGGQSNAEGFGIGPVNANLLPEISDNVFYLESDHSVESLPDWSIVIAEDECYNIVPAHERGAAANPVGDFALSFSSLYEQSILKKDRKLLIVRSAVGGTGFVKKQWGINNPLHQRMINMTDYALSLNEENRVVGFLWHQGECEAFEKNAPDLFKKDLSKMLQVVRERYGANLPFVCGDFATEWKNKYLADCEAIAEKMREVVLESGHAAFVETSDLLSNNQKTANGDDIHFCREALYILGQRYFNAYNTIINEN